MKKIQYMKTEISALTLTVLTLLMAGCRQENQDRKSTL